MDRLLKFGLIACVAGLAYLLQNPQGGMLVNLFVAPALGLIACALLFLTALGSMLASSRSSSRSGSLDGGDV